jgi:hypothetical protein
MHVFRSIGAQAPVVNGSPRRIAWGAACPEAFSFDAACAQAGGSSGPPAATADLIRPYAPAQSRDLATAFSQRARNSSARSRCIEGSNVRSIRQLSRMAPASSQ